MNEVLTKNVRIGKANKLNVTEYNLEYCLPISLQLVPVSVVDIYYRNRESLVISSLVFSTAPNVSPCKNSDRPIHFLIISPPLVYISPVVCFAHTDHDCLHDKHFHPERCRPILEIHDNFNCYRLFSTVSFVLLTQVFKNPVHGTGNQTRLIGVFDSNNEFSVVCSSEKIVVKCCSKASEMQIA